MIDFWDGKKVFVTGATGFIGSALVETLVDRGAFVVSLVRSDGWNWKTTSLDGSVVYTGDVSNYHLMCEIISTHEIEYIFHLAANAIVRVAARDPMSTYQTNVMGTVSILEAARNVGRCKKIIVASSDKAYGDHEILPYVENMSLQPKHTYDTSKACADLIARTYANNYGMPIVVTRCSNVYGPGDPNESRIIPNSIMRIHKGLRPQLYSDVSSLEREFIYIDDVVNANLALAQSGVHTDGEAYNIGRNERVEVRSVVQTILSMMGKDAGDVEIIQRENVFKEIKKQSISPEKIERATGWKATTTLQEGLEKSIVWYTS